MLDPFRRLARLPRQLLRLNPFEGDLLPALVPLFAPGSGRPTVPFPHPWNYQEPLSLLEAIFWRADEVEGPGRHNRYLEVPGCSPILVTRDPPLIRAITSETGDKPGEFDRDTLPSAGIARATGPDTLLYSNGATWRRQRKLSASPFGKTTLFQPERFGEFATTFRQTVSSRLDEMQLHMEAQGITSMTLPIEPEVQSMMLEMLTNNFFGAEIPYQQLRDEYVPALQGVIDHIVRDTVINKLGLPIWKMPSFTRRIAQAKEHYQSFERLTDTVLAARRDAKGLWGQFKSDAPDERLRSNIKVFLAGALEATTSFACWAISHLARNEAAQERVYAEVAEIEEYTPETLESATYFGHVLEETLRLTPSLYFLPRRATADRWIETADGRRLFLPRGTHILLDVWHANRHDDHWGPQISGYPALEFAPERWQYLAEQGRGSKERLHFGFGHGPRVCPGKHLGQLEVGLLVGAMVKVFSFKAPTIDNPARAGVSTKPRDGTEVELTLRYARQPQSSVGSH